MGKLVLLQRMTGCGRWVKAHRDGLARCYVCNHPRNCVEHFAGIKRGVIRRRRGKLDKKADDYLDYPAVKTPAFMLDLLSRFK
jgi:hypothetical protein